jgi:hypothetical protein
MSLLARSRYLIGFVVCLLALLSTCVLGEVPRKINYQGRLTEAATGLAMPGSHNMTFSIYDVPDGGTELWSEPVVVQVDSAGVFSAILGSTNPIDLAFEKPLWLEVAVEGEVLTPRREMVSVPFALAVGWAHHAADSDSLSGLHGDAYALTGHTHTEFVVRDETGSITGTMILDGEITDDDISPGAGIDPAKIAGTAWTSTNDGEGSGLDADMVDGRHADAFADTAHEHDEIYLTREEAFTSGTVNSPDNPVDWTRLKNVPEGLADGVDDVGGAGDGHSLDAADGEPADVVFVNNAGKVGIGTTNPTLAQLEVLAAAENAITGSSNDAVGVYGFSNDGTGVLGVTNNGRAGSFVGDVYVSGSLGVGTDTPGATLGVSGNIDADSLYLIKGERAFFSSARLQTTVIGVGAGQPNPDPYNTFVGSEAGHNCEDILNTFIGARAGYRTTTGHSNTFVGSSAGRRNTDGIWNTLIGAGAGDSLGEGNTNTMVGAYAGTKQREGYGNTYVGSHAGFDNQAGSGNVFIGRFAGYYEQGSNKLIIANDYDTTSVLIYGDFSAGRVGLGTLAPERHLHIKGANPRLLIEAVSLAPEVNFKHTGDASSDVWAIYKEGTTDDLRFYQGGDKIWIRGGTGNVGLGHDPGSYKLYVQGDAHITGSWNPSDLRFKRDIEQIEGALEKVMDLRGVSFLWRSEEYAERDFDTGRHYGVIAQEIEEVLPEVVREGPRGEKAVAYSQIVPVLIEAIKTQEQKIQALEERIAKLESRSPERR